MYDGPSVRLYCRVCQIYPQTLFSFIHVFISIYPFTGTTQGCGESHNIIYNISVELQMS